MLENERQKYIAAMDFARAREIESHIKQLRAGSSLDLSMHHLKIKRAQRSPILNTKSTAR